MARKEKVSPQQELFNLAVAIVKDTDGRDRVPEDRARAGIVISVVRREKRFWFFSKETYVDDFFVSVEKASKDSDNVTITGMFGMGSGRRLVIEAEPSPIKGEREVHVRLQSINPELRDSPIKPDTVSINGSLKADGTQVGAVISFDERGSRRSLFADPKLEKELRHHLETLREALPAKTRFIPPQIPSPRTRR